MDMLKVVKIRSIENADYTPQQNRMRFKIPADNLNTHLDESYLSFQVQPKQSNGSNITSTMNIGFGNANDSLPYYPTCLFKVARLFSGDSNIPLEEINKYNLLDLNMKIYQKDLESMASDQYEAGFFVDDLFQADKSPFYLEGQADIHIPLKDIFGLCKNKDFYLSNTGGLQIEFELEDQYSLFVQNSNSKLSQRVYTSFETTQSVAPLSTLNNKYISSTLDPTTQPAVPLDPSELLGNQELLPQGSPLNNFYISVSNVAYGTYDSTNKRFPVALTVSLTTNTIYGSGKTYQAYGISSVAGNTVLKNSNWKLMPISLVYKISDTNKGELFGRPLQNLTATLTDFIAPSTNAIINAFLPWENNTAPTGIVVKAVACCTKLADATNKLFYQLAVTNTFGGVIPASYARIGGTIPQICTSTGTAIQLAVGSGSNYPTLTFTSGSLQSINFTVGAYYVVRLQPINSSSTAWTPSVNSNNSRINVLQNLAYMSPNGSLKLFIFKATDETVLTFTKIYEDKDDSFNINSLNEIIATRVHTTANVGEIYIQQYIPAPGEMLSDVEQVNLSYSIPKAELVLVQEAKKSSDSISNVYMTWKMEPTLIENSTNYWQKQFILEPNVASACLVYPPQFTNSSQSMYSSDSSLTRYRWALDNIDNTNRDVIVNDALHNDKLIDWFNNTNMKLKSLPGSELLQTNTSIIPMKIYTAVDNENMYMDNKSHTLQVVLKGDENQLTAKNLYLYKQVLKTL